MVVEPDCDTEKISEVVSSVVPGAEVNRVHGKELDITLPQSGVEQFPGTLAFQNVFWCVCLDVVLV